jgi:VanZ family protein
MTLVRRFRPALVWMVVIAVLTSVPNPPSPKSFAHADKLVHFFLYAVLGLLIARPLVDGAFTPWGKLVLAATFCAAAGALDEWHQQWIPGRSMDVHDWAADAVGAMAGVATAAVAATRARTPRNA